MAEAAEQATVAAVQEDNEMSLEDLQILGGTEEPSLFYQLMDPNSILRQWILRILVSVALILLYQYMNPSNSPTGGAFGGSGKRVDAPVSRLLGLEEKRNDVDSKDASPEPSAPVKEEEESPNPSAPKEEKAVEEETNVIQQRTVEPEMPRVEAPPDQAAPRRVGRGRRTVTPAAPPVTPAPVTLKARNPDHPGLEQFNYWYNVEASLYRIYSIGELGGDGTEVAPPFIPRSERGHVSVHLIVTNDLLQDVSCYWVNYKGKEELKSVMRGRGGQFRSMTWIGHPFVFRAKETGQLLLHYIPYRVIPTTPQVPTHDENDETLGVHRFSLKRNIHQKFNQVCLIDDPIFPTHIDTVQQAAAFSFQHMSRMNYACANTCLKYLTNILRHPSERKYRKIRTANKKFYAEVWNTAARGLFLAAGFKEEGAFLELGTNDPLPSHRVQDVSSLVFYLEKWKEEEERNLARAPASGQQQPDGADGYGRAGFGHAGGLNPNNVQF
uniref:PUB domain-containing protein n=1 Tax=Grammatophora oceanica TaxID=210454 RepID=A0A7S1VQI1_9STRA|mmetsp:Transcript_53114/g.79386  ORF Transcript_53114/g.79386 Transcript_53114/m.79386 type:complete len:496 (+) Transcript_53114:33-1520(+)